jgi:hypothetical protein
MHKGALTMIDKYDDRPTIPLTAVELDRAKPADAWHLLDALWLGDADACIKAARELHTPIDRWLLDKLLIALNDTNMAVRVAATATLGELRSTEALAPLVGLLKELSLPDHVRWAAAQAIRAIKGQATAANERSTMQLPAPEAERTAPTIELVPIDLSSVPAAQPVAPQHLRARRWLVASLLLIAVAVAGYYLGGLYIDAQISAAYTRADCAEVVATASATLGYYPSVVAPWAGAAAHKAEECQYLLDARAKQSAKGWLVAHQAYSKFLANYPATPFGTTVRTQLTEVIFAWAEQLQHAGDYQAALDTYALLNAPEQDVQRYQAEAKTYAAWAESAAAAGDYAVAVAQLQTVLTTYADSSAASPAGERVIQLYNDWATQLRKQHSYPSAEQVYTELIKWAGERHDQAALSAAQIAQGQLYIQWSARLQHDGDFTTALSKLKLALRSNASAQDATGPAARARAAIPQLHSAWGAALLKQRKFADAVDQLRTAADLLAKGDAQQLVAAQEQLVSAYLAWGATFRASSEFQHALDRIAQARAVPATPALAATVSQAEAQTIDAFAHSANSEAQAVMQQAIANVCERQQVAESPLIARDERPKQVAAYHLPITLLDPQVSASTPAALHYVACTETQQNRIESCQYYDTDSTVVSGWIFRETISWVITLRDLKTSAVVGQQTFTGGQPEACQAREFFRTGVTAQKKVGQAPTLEEIEAWLKSFVE